MLEKIKEALSAKENYVVDSVEGGLAVRDTLNPDFKNQHVLLTVEDERVFCRTIILERSDIEKEKQADINAMFLTLCPLLTLSAVGMDEKEYFLYGELSANSDVEQVVEEVEVLIQNTSEILDSLNEVL